MQHTRCWYWNCLPGFTSWRVILSGVFDRSWISTQSSSSDLSGAGEITICRGYLVSIRSACYTDSFTGCWCIVWAFGRVGSAVVEVICLISNASQFLATVANHLWNVVLPVMWLLSFVQALAFGWFCSSFCLFAASSCVSAWMSKCVLKMFCSQC